MLFVVVDFAAAVCWRICHGQNNQLSDSQRCLSSFGLTRRPLQPNVTVAPLEQEALMCRTLIRTQASFFFLLNFHSLCLCFGPQARPLFLFNNKAASFCSQWVILPFYCKRQRVEETETSCQNPLGSHNTMAFYWHISPSDARLKGVVSNWGNRRNLKTSPLTNRPDQ